MPSVKNLMSVTKIKKQGLLSVNGMRPPEMEILKSPKISKSLKETYLALFQFYLPNDNGYQNHSDFFYHTK
jgi:hypothetical protein